ncbi:MAG: hypothetical protein ACYDGM_01465 [Vulcanimicrobiaceae bacterium]
MLEVRMLPFLMALLVAVPSPSPPPHTIETVKTTPFCNALQRHFNGAFVPMLGNDQSLQVVGVQLGDLNSLFTRPTYASDFFVLRGRLMKQVGEIAGTLPQIGAHIEGLRASVAFSSDPTARAGMLATVAALQSAYAMQKQIAYDLHSLVQSMMEYDPLSGNHPAGGMDPADIGIPHDMLDIKSYLRYDARRDTMEKAQSTAVDRALALAQGRCS